MTTKQALLDLATRVEALEGPDRSVDAEIAAAVYGGEIEWLTQKWVMESYPARRAPSANHVGGFAKHPVEAVTGSLDAAMTLVPEGYDWIIGRTNDGLTIHAEVGGRGDDYTRFAATPPLALTAASLRAIAEGMDE